MKKDSMTKDPLRLHRVDTEKMIYPLYESAGRIEEHSEEDGPMAVGEVFAILSLGLASILAVGLVFLVAILIAAATR